MRRVDLLLAIALLAIVGVMVGPAMALTPGQVLDIEVQAVDSGFSPEAAAIASDKQSAIHDEALSPITTSTSAGQATIVLTTGVELVATPQQMSGKLAEPATDIYVTINSEVVYKDVTAQTAGTGLGEVMSPAQTNTAHRKAAVKMQEQMTAPKSTTPVVGAQIDETASMTDQARAGPETERQACVIRISGKTMETAYREAMQVTRTGAESQSLGSLLARHEKAERTFAAFAF